MWKCFGVYSSLIDAQCMKIFHKPLKNLLDIVNTIGFDKRKLVKFLDITV